MKTRILLLIGMFTLFISCGEGTTKTKVETATVHTNTQADYAVEVSMEGKTLVLKQGQLAPNIRYRAQDTLQFLVWSEDQPLKLNLNLNNTNILEHGEATYTIPDVNSPKVKVDLSFFNLDRDVKRTNKRIIFRKGTIQITKINEHELHMTFEGEGSGVLEYGKNFPISGEANFSF